MRHRRSQKIIVRPSLQFDRNIQTIRADLDNLQEVLDKYLLYEQVDAMDITNPCGHSLNYQY